MNNKLLCICLLVLFSCQKGARTGSGFHDEVSSKKDSIMKDDIALTLDTTSINSDQDSGRVFIGEPCFSTSPKEIGSKIDSLAKSFNGLKCPDGDKNVVFVEFLVDSAGNTSDIKVKKSFCPRLDKIALKIVAIAKFKPALCGEKKTQMRMTYKLNFSQSF